MSGPETTKVNKQTSPPTEKKQERASIAELKNGKVVFKQKPVSFEKQSETLQEIVKFRAMLEDKISAKSTPLSVFPDEHKPLIAKLAHESDKTLNVLAKHIHHELLPTIDEDEDKDVASATSAALPLILVERVIQDILVRNNYGIDVPLGMKPHAAISVWRWEVKNEYVNWLPKNSREKADLRQAERVQAKEDLKSLFEACSQEERDAIIDPKGLNKVLAKDLAKPAATQGTDSKLDAIKGTPQSSKKQGKKKTEEPEDDTPNGKSSRLKKAQDPEKLAKEKEKLEKKAAKAEKEKKEKDAHNKSQSIMAKFFSKPKSPSRMSKPTKQQESAIAGPSRIQSDFEKTFKPFVLQKDKVMAPSNWFLAEKKRKRRAALSTSNQEVIVLDSDEEMDIEEQVFFLTESQLEAAPNQERLNSILATLPTGATPVRAQHHRWEARKARFQVHNPVSVRDLLSQLSEAEISGNDDLVRFILTKLGDRELLPAKAFCFHTDARPGYFGTWTRSSRIIGPRTPFAKDTLVFDYAYDSGEEWEEEPVGEDVVEDGGEEDGDGDEPDSDLDSWLVDDDEEPNLALLGHESSPPPLLDFPSSVQPKRKAEDGERKIGKKRKVVVPLVPFAKGPFFETTIGQCEYDPFKTYAIQLFNDTPLSIDPFTFVSTCVEDYRARTTITTTTANESTFAVPAVPPRLTSITNTTTGSAAANSSSNVPTAVPQAPKKVSAVPKSTFPEVYMPVLIAKFAQIQASSISALVESIHLELREHKVKKAAIEAKVREVGEKCKDKKVWILKPAILQQ